MADNERERSRSPEGGGEGGDGGAPPAADDSNAAPAPAPQEGGQPTDNGGTDQGNAAGGGDGGGEAEGIKLYVGNLDYGTSVFPVALLVVDDSRWFRRFIPLQHIHCNDSHTRNDLFFLFVILCSHGRTETER